MNTNELESAKKKQLVDEIKAYFSSERNEDIGDLAAELILDFIMAKIAPAIYNQAVSDCFKYFSEKLDDMFELQKY